MSVAASKRTAAERRAKTAPGWNRLLSRILLVCPSGDLLDDLVLHYRPKPGEISFLPSESVLTSLGRERNLYAESLRAATTEDVDGFLADRSTIKRPVRRALARNPRLSSDRRLALFREAERAGDPPLVLALLQGAPDVLELLTQRPAGLELLSLRAGQPAPDVLALKARSASPESLNHLTASNPTSGMLWALLHTGMPSVAEDLSAERFRASYEYLLELVRLFEMLRLKHGDTVPQYLGSDLATHPGSEVLAILRVFGPPKNHETAVKYREPLLRVGDCTSAAVLAATPIHQIRSAWSYRHGRDRPQGFFLQDWCDEALEVVVQGLLADNPSRDRLETFAALLPEWEGPVTDLLLAAKSL